MTIMLKIFMKIIGYFMNYITMKDTFFPYLNLFAQIKWYLDFFHHVKTNIFFYH